MIHPYTVGPMALSGITWFQGEANTRDALSAELYGCLFPQMITSWRRRLQSPRLFFAFAQLSTWCAQDVFSLPAMRDAQMAAAALPQVGWATDADRGDTCNIHPGWKQDIGRRLADSALALVNGQDRPWRSPRDSGAKQAPEVGSGIVAVDVSLSDVGAAGMDIVYPWNMDVRVHAGQNRTVTNCTMGSPTVNNVANQTANQCGWAGIEVEGLGWLNATVSAAPDGAALRLEAVLPGAGAKAAAAVVTGSAYGWSTIPMMNAYDRATGLPVLPWNRSL
eukprot:g6052.t1